MHRENDQTSPSRSNQGDRGPRRRGGRSRQRNNQGGGNSAPRGRRDNDEYRREGDGGHDRRRNRYGNDGDDGFRIERTSPPQSNRKPATESLGRKVLRFLSFGLIGGKPSSKPKNSSPNGTRKPQPKGAPTRPKSPPANMSRKSERPIDPVDIESIDTARLHVGNLSYDATESDLFDLFKGFGKVTNTEIVSNPHTQRSKGFGFVQMSSVPEARRAVSELHGKDFMRRKLILGPAKNSERRRPSERDERDERDDSDRA